MKNLIKYILFFFLILFIGIAFFVYFNQDKILLNLMHRQAENLQMRTDLLEEKEGITVITVGTAAPLPSRRNQSCTAVFVNGHFFVFDVGDGAVQGMENLSLPLNKLNAAFITHWHSDHFIDLPYLINRSWLLGRNSDLEIYAPEGADTIIHSINNMLSLENGYREEHHGKDIINSRYGVGIPFEINLSGIKEAVVFEKDGIRISAFDVRHDPIEPAFGFKIEYNGKKVVLSGDTRKNENVLAQSQNADLLIHEVMAMDFFKNLSKIQTDLGNDRNAKILIDITDYHTSPRDVAEIAKAANVKKLVLNHLAPSPDNWLLKRLFLNEMEGVYNGEIVLAEDGDFFVVR